MQLNMCMYQARVRTNVLTKVKKKTTKIEKAHCQRKQSENYYSQLVMHIVKKQKERKDM